MATNAYIKKAKRSQINNLSLYLKELKKEKQTKPQFRRRKKTIKIRAEVNQIEKRKTAEKLIKLRIGFLKKIKSTTLSKTN